VADNDLAELLARLDEETRLRWERHLIAIDHEVSERGPSVVRERLEAALANLLAAGWALHRCYAHDDEGVARVMKPLGDAAVTVEELRQTLDEMAKKPEWSQ
jgi:hypothetical protein